MTMDRRIFDRIETAFPAKLKKSSEQSEEDVLLKDVSAEGLKVVSPRRIPLNDRISLKVFLPDGHDPLTLDAEVIWSQMMDSRNWDTGLKFNEVNLMRTQRILRSCPQEVTVL